MSAGATLPLPDGGALYHEVHGHGPPLLLVAGLGGVAQFWAAQVDALAARFTVVVHDHRGTGRSSHDRIAYSIEQMTADVVALMDGLELARAHLVGHSTGGAIGQQLALSHPERLSRLVLSATWGSPDPYMQRLFALRAEVLRRCGAQTWQRQGELLQFPPAWFRERPPPRDEADTLPGADIDVDIVLSRIDALLHFDRGTDIASIRAPTLVIHAADDMIVPPHCGDALAASIPGARHVLEPTGGHFLPVSRPDVYREHLLAFLHAG